MGNIEEARYGELRLLMRCCSDNYRTNCSITLFLYLIFPVNDKSILSSYRTFFIISSALYSNKKTGFSIEKSGF